MTASAAAQGTKIEAMRPPRHSVLWAIALAGCAAAAYSFAVVAGTGDGLEPRVHGALVAWIILSYIVCGLVAWWRRPDSRFGLLMIVAGFSPLASTFSHLSAGLPYTIGEALHVLPPAFFLHVFLAYPTGRLERAFERAIVAAGYLAAVALQLLRMVLGGFSSHNLLEVAAQPDVADVVFRVQVAAISVVALTAVGVLVVRRLRAGRHLRRSRELLLDSFVLALVAIAVGVPLSKFSTPLYAPARGVAFAVIGLAPVVLLIGLLGARLARSAVGELFVELRTDPAPADLRDALARALGDPSLTLAYWLPDFASFADLEGRPVELPTHDGRAITLIDRSGGPVAALLHDPALKDEPELLDAVTAAAGIALENGRLHAELRARLEELRGSRARIVDAGQTERKRLERNLHDGAQQRLIALSVELGLLEEGLGGDADARRRLDQARREIATSLEELRDVARGIHPAVVSGHGLEIALEQLAARASVPVRLSVEAGGRLPESLEVAAFYLVSESLANIGKHASATSATVAVARADGRLVVEVTDDGVGGADTERGSGLRGLADRVEALDGQLRVWSPRGSGTRLRAEIPCVS